MERIERLRLRGVTRSFAATVALRQFDLELTGGAFTTLLGPSGCGKSTVLNCIAGLLDLTEGEILLNGRPIQQIPAEKRGFGMVFQNYALFPHLSVSRNVSYGLEIRGVAKGQREERVRRALDLVQLPYDTYAKRLPAQLSGGQQQRLAIARTIVLEPSLLLLDEPLSNLDANLRNELRIEIKRLHTELGLTTVYVTHDQAEAMSLSDTVVVMRQGQIEQVGTPQEIYNRPRSLYVAGFMGYVNRLPVTLLSNEGDVWLAQAENGAQLRATVPWGEQQTGLRAGQRALLCIRPDETLAEPLPTGNTLRGRVRLVEYLGKAFEAVVVVEGSDTLQVLAQSSRPLNIGDEVEVSLRPERLLVFADEAGGGEEGGGVAGAATKATAPQQSPSETALQGAR